MTAFTRARFQEAAVQHIIGRLKDRSGSRRMLLADEVGLGKTVVARGVIEGLLKGRRTPLTVIYLCSNVEIAEQNRRKLDPRSRRPIGRVTQLALTQPDKTAPLLLYSFTPGTSLKGGTGLAWERRLLLYLLHRVYGVPVWRRRWREFFRCGAGREKWLGTTTRRTLRDAFARKTTTTLQAALAVVWRCMVIDGEPVVQVMQRMVADFDPGDADARRQRNQLIAKLRAVMQRVVLRDLSPDLVVLDEVQRFREVLDEAASAEHLAAVLFAQRVPVLILSATPYRALTLGHEVTDGAASHYEDFFRILDFLFDRDTDTPRRIKSDLRAFGERLRRLGLADTLDQELLALKQALEAHLTKVICRTERNWYVLDRRKGIDDTSGDSGTLPGRGELEEFFRLYGGLAAFHGMGQVTEFWKSAPSLLTFLDSKYALLRKLREQRIKVPRGLLTAGNAVTALADRNHRISRVLDVSLGDDKTPPRLWAAPTYTYYRDELYGASRPRKLLVFSGWRFVPKTVAIVASRVATDRVGGALDEATQPLRFSDRRSFHAFDACLPTPVLAAVGDTAYRTARDSTAEPGAEDVVAVAGRELRRRLKALGVSVVPAGGDSTWRVAMRLETETDQGARMTSALNAWGSGTWDDTMSEAERQHRDWANDWLADRRSSLRISVPRVQRLALIAAFSPANCVLRAVESVYPVDEAGDALAGITTLCLGPMRRYFNRSHVQQLIRQHRVRLPGWRQRTKGARGYTARVLGYAGDAHLQAVLDEYLYLLRHATQCETVDDARRHLADVWGLSQGTPRTNGAKGSGKMVHIAAEAEPHATHFALAFGEDAAKDSRDEGDAQKIRKSVVREAFNSPFWPFVLATTSVGQEGLDFHLYCRDVLHWNLPSNPVDPEQREGRVNRRDCLAVRASIAQDWPLERWAARGGHTHRNPWPQVFEDLMAHDDVQKYKHGLFPHWVYECRTPEHTVRIQRHVPFFSTSRDATKYERLKAGLALYRLVFGQANQEDLLDDLQQRLGGLAPKEHEKALRRLSSYMLNLSPIGHAEAVRHSQEEADSLLDGYPEHDGVETLLRAVARMRTDRPDDLAVVNDEIEALVQFVQRALAAGDVRSRQVRVAVAALTYLRNPYDHVFDLQVDGGFDDDIAVLRDAYSAVRHR